MPPEKRDLRRSFVSTSESDAIQPFEQHISLQTALPVSLKLTLPGKVIELRFY